MQQFTLSSSAAVCLTHTVLTRRTLLVLLSKYLFVQSLFLYNRTQISVKRLEKSGTVGRKCSAWPCMAIWLQAADCSIVCSWAPLQLMGTQHLCPGDVPHSTFFRFLHMFVKSIQDSFWIRVSKRNLEHAKARVVNNTAGIRLEAY
jgi:hypothetical protein